MNDTNEKIISLPMRLALAVLGFLGLAKKPASDKPKNSLVEGARFIIEVGLIVFVVRSFAMEPFYIPSSSMVPNLLIGDYILVNKNAYGYSKYSFPFAMFPFNGRVMGSLPERGEIVVFRNPYHTDIDFVKRAVGLPGDKIQVIKGHLHINGEAVEKIAQGEFQLSPENILSQAVPQYTETLGRRRVNVIEMFGDNGGLDNTAEYIVPDGHIFTMGDNRDNSNDSRVLTEVGFIPVENLVGRAYLVLFSWNSNFDGGKFWQFIRWDRFFKYVNQ